MKTALNKKRVFMIAAGVFVLAAVITILCLLLRGGQQHRAASPSATPTATVSPIPSAALVEPSATPEPMITPPAAEPGNAASGSDIYVSIQLPATDSDLG